MGFKENWFKDFAVALAKESANELERAKERFNSHDYAYSVFHSQQCTEKMTKSVLEMNHIINREHYVSNIFKHEVASNNKSLLKLVKMMKWFEIDNKWSTCRYPIKRNRKIKLPNEIFTKSIAKIALSNAKIIFETLKKTLENEYGVKI